MADLEGMEARVIARVCNEGGVNVVTESGAVGLIERLERLTEPDRELDGDIGILVGPWTRHDLGDGCWQWRYNGVNFGNRPPAYTRSVDAAMTLVPGGWHFDLHCMWGFPKVRASVDRDWPHMGRHDGWHESLAIALCIAALKARREATQVSEERASPASSSTPSVPNAPVPDTQGKD